MKCEKCGGLMNFEEFMDISEAGFSWGYEGWRCLSCGDVLDPLILMNRMKTGKPVGRAVPVTGSQRFQKKAA